MLNFHRLQRDPAGPPLSSPAARPGYIAGNVGRNVPLVAKLQTLNAFQE